MANDPPCGPALPLRPTQVTCHNCSLSRLCLPVSLQEEEITCLEGIIKRNRPLHKHEYLIRAGTRVESVYALRAGAMKTYLLAQDGVEQITGFHLPGELIGLDAIGEALYPSYSVALETSMVCAISLHQLEELAGQIPGLRKQLLHTMSKEIQAEHEHLSHNRESAEQRLAAFLLNLSARYSKRGLSASNFILPMSRRDIGNYLGLSMETVSRLFTRFREMNLIDSSGRELHLLDIQALGQQGHPYDEGRLRYPDDVTLKPPGDVPR
ncbi:Transcriptional activator protein Anr [compost metagenome]